MLTPAEAEKAPFILHCLLNSYSLAGGSLPLFNPCVAAVPPALRHREMLPEVGTGRAAPQTPGSAGQRGSREGLARIE